METRMQLAAVTLACILFAAADARPLLFGKGSGSIQLPLLSIGSSYCPSPTAKRSTAQAAELLNGKSSIKDPDNWLETWNPKKDACKWAGIKCDKEGVIVEINIAGFGLQGSLPLEWTAVTTVKKLNLASNAFTGPIPSCYGNLAALEELKLDDNKLSGPLPKEFGNLAKLEVLEIQNNNFVGSIPAEWGNMKSLKRLNLFNNPTLGGCVPAAFKAQGTEFELRSVEDQVYTKDVSDADARVNTGITGFC